MSPPPLVTEDVLLELTLEETRLGMDRAEEEADSGSTKVEDAGVCLYVSAYLAWFKDDSDNILSTSTLEAEADFFRGAWKGF